MTKNKTDTEEKLTDLVGDKPRPTSDNPFIDSYIEQAVKKQDVLVETAEASRADFPGYDALSELGKAEFARTGVMPSTAAIPRSDLDREIEASQTSITNAAIRHQNTYGVQPEAPAPYFQPNVASESHVSIMAHLDGARALLSRTGHFEHNECVKLIDQAIALCIKCEETEEP